MKKLLFWIVFLTTSIGIGFFSYNKIQRLYSDRLPLWETIFVSANTPNQTQNGSLTHPFKTILSALEAIKDNPSFNKLIILPGDYPEILNFDIEGLTIMGSGENSPLIFNQEEKGPITITVSADSTFFNLNFSKGKNVILIKPNTKTRFIKTEIQQGRDYGIETEENTNLIVHKSTIAANGLQGLYLRKGLFEISDSFITKNGEEGIDLHFGMTSLIKNSFISENGEGGIETELNDINLTVQDCLVEKNGSSGINLQSSGQNSAVLIRNNKINENANFGVRCAIHKGFTPPYFVKMVKIENTNSIEKNGETAIDPNCNF